MHRILVYCVLFVLFETVMGSLIMVKGSIITHKPIFYTWFYS